ncbi:MAG: hypothetical protein M3Q57_00330 [Pseudomonadota bacterium]|nr:hypothetical protein [Pseudomonadota bacterium]
MVIYAAVISVVVSLSLVVVAFAAPALPIWPIIAINWALFMAVTWLVGHQVSSLRRGGSVSRANHNIWRTVIIAFSGCGCIAFAAGATIV